MPFYFINNLLSCRLGCLLQPAQLSLQTEHHLRQAGGLRHLHLRVPARPRLQPQCDRDQPHLSPSGHQRQVNIIPDISSDHHPMSGRTQAAHILGQ